MDWWMCCAAVVMSVAAGGAQELPWWKTAVFYQIYPRSFQDSNGDGVGDLKGITERAGYLKEIGVTATWLSPIFKSPMADFGYDISDYRAIDPTFGTMDDLKALTKRLKELDIKLLLDLVPNHSSDEHEWFHKSELRQEPYTDYYVWKNGSVDPMTGERKPPNNWMSVFGGPAWEWSDQREQYYLHQFAKKQPDLNYDHSAVRKEMDDILKFWLDQGVDGFRVDAVPFLFEDEKFRDEPHLEGTAGATYFELDHRYTQNLPQTFELLQHWADLVYNYEQTDGKPRALFLEAYADLPTTFRYYGLGNQGLMQPFNFGLLTNGNQTTRPRHLRDLILGWVDAMPKGVVPNWVIGNHDNGRVAERYGPEMVDAMNLLTGVLPGVKVVYYGEEIGMQNTFIRWDQTVDVSGRNLGPDHFQEASRDPERTPMQWDDTLNAGFSTHEAPWLPVNPNYWWLNVAAQQSSETSHLKVFQAMTQARKDPVLQRGDLDVLVPDEDTLLVSRKYQDSSFLLVINMGSQMIHYSDETLGQGQNMTVAVASVNSGFKAGETLKPGAASLSLRPKAAVLLKSMVPHAPEAR